MLCSLEINNTIDKTFALNFFGTVRENIKTPLSDKAFELLDCSLSMHRLKDFEIILRSYCTQKLFKSCIFLWVANSFCYKTISWGVKRISLHLLDYQAEIETGAEQNRSQSS